MTSVLRWGAVDPPHPPPSQTILSEAYAGVGVVVARVAIPGVAALSGSGAVASNVVQSIKATMPGAGGLTAGFTQFSAQALTVAVPASVTTADHHDVGSNFHVATIRTSAVIPSVYGGLVLDNNFTPATIVTDTKIYSGISTSSFTDFTPPTIVAVVTAPAAGLTNVTFQNPLASVGQVIAKATVVTKATIAATTTVNIFDTANLTYWNGNAEEPVVVEGEWNGSVVVPLTVGVY